MRVHLKNECDTQKLAAQFAAVAKKGDIFLLIGDLGAGKTFFVRSFAQAYGCEDMVSSPTFNIMNQYQNDRISINHFDLYRIKSEEELLGIGFEDFLSDGVVLIEWPDPALGLLEGVEKTSIEFLFENEGRTAIITGKYEEILHDNFGA